VIILKQGAQFVILKVQVQICEERSDAAIQKPQTQALPCDSWIASPSAYWYLHLQAQ